MSHMTAISMEAGSQVARGLALGSMAVDTFGREIRKERRAAANSVDELAIRLQEARQDQAAAQRRAVAAERAQDDLAVEVRLLSKALSDERRELAAMKSAYASLLARSSRAA
jgi:hypothetical protein